MRRFTWNGLVALLLAGLAGAQIKVVATIPDLKVLAEAIGGDRVEVTSIARGRENLHAVRLKPSHVVGVSRADLFLQVGLSLEHAWVPELLRTARNKEVQPSGKGFVSASTGWKPIQVPKTLSKREGVDVHPEGNPHINLDPNGGPHMAQRVLEGLIRVDPDGEEAYREGHAAWTERYQEAAERWAKARKAFDGHKVVIYHREFDYLLESLGIEVAAVVEPKPGVPPTGRHLLEVITTARKQKVGVVLTASWSNDRTVEKVADRSDAEIVELPAMVGGHADATDWIAMMDLMHARLADGLGIELPEDDG